MPKSGPTVGVCKLCLIEGALIRSHVIPRWLMKTVKSGGKYRQIDPATETSIVGQDDYAEHLLCGPCDNSFSDSENYVRHLYTKWMAIPSPEEGHPQLVFPSHATVDYHKVRLFLLATVWRMSIATHPVFGNVKLTSEEEEQLRRKLLLRDVDPYTQYSCVPLLICLAAIARL